jgi:hypothetical protein
MDFWTQLAFNAVLQLIGNRKDAKRFYPVLAKVYVKIHLLAQLEPDLQKAIRVQEVKVGEA